jgi:hypothetical protein
MVLKEGSSGALSSCEAKCIAASMAACQAQWLSMLMQELGLRKWDFYWVASKSTIDTAKQAPCCSW